MPAIKIPATITKAQLAACAELYRHVNGMDLVIGDVTYPAGTLRYVTFAGKVELPVSGKGCMSRAEREALGEPLYLGHQCYETLSAPDLSAPSYFATIPTMPPAAGE